MRLEVSEQVLTFARNLARDSRRALRLALRDLAKDHGDIKALHGELTGFFRLRVRSYRIVFRYITLDEARCTQCVFAERRAAVYGHFQRLLTEGRLER